MSRVALITDTHFGIYQNNSMVRDHQMQFFDDVFYPELEKRGIKSIIHLGDLVDYRTTIDYFTLGLIKDHFFRQGYEYHVIIGNHDCYFKNTIGVNAPQILFSHYIGAFINIIDRPFYHEGMLLMPWIARAQREEFIKRIESSNDPWLLGHLELKGYKMSNSRVAEQGYTETQLRLSKFKRVLSGHFHHKSDDGHVCYLGSPYQMKWDDYGDARGFHVFDTVTGDLEFIENPSRLFQKITYNNGFEETCKGAFVKVIIESKQSEVAFEKDLAALENDNMKVAVLDAESILQDADLDEMLVESKGTLGIITEYVESLDIEDKQRKHLNKLVTSLYSEATQTRL